MQNNDNTTPPLPPECLDAAMRRARRGLRHRLAWALMPEDMRYYWRLGFIVAMRPSDVFTALFDKFIFEMADKEDRG